LKTTNAFSALFLASFMISASSISAQQLAMNSTLASSNVASRSFTGSGVTSDNKPPVENENNSAKAFKNFERKFRNATDVKQSPLATGTIIYCKIDNISNELYYDKKGNLSHSVRYFDESKLNAAVREMVLDKYNGYDIFGVIEVTVDDQKVFHIKLQSRSTWKTVQVNGDIMKETESFKI
jgi:hypothetical protein